jgi:Rod binding domain-containing protein
MAIEGIAAAAGAGEVPQAAPRKIKDAAVEFESLLMGQLLKCIREAESEGWLGGGEDQAGATMMEVAEEHLARVLAAQGGLGLANLVVAGLERKTGAD